MIQAVEKMESIPTGENPFWHDLYHMGSDVTKDFMVMFDRLEDAKYLILVNKKTGERMKIWLDIHSEWEHMGDFYPSNYYTWSEGDECVPVLTHRPAPSQST